MSQPAASPDPALPRPSGPPVHPVAAAALLFVDNLWMLADWNALTWLITIPLSFLSVAATTFFLQRFLNRDGWTKSFGKGVLLGIIAGVPTSVTGTPVGLALLTWAGIMRAKSGATPLPLRSVPESTPNQPPPAIPIHAQVVPAPPPPPAPAASQTPAPPRRVEPWWVKLVMVLLLCGTILLVTKMVLDRTAGIAAKFRQAHITETFTSALPKLARTPGGNLELATSTSTETVTRTDERTIAWDIIYLGKTVSEISVPVTYRFHLQLRDTWKLDVTGSTCIVRAPAIRPSLPPAIHTEGMQKRSEAGWARFDAREQMAELERSLTPRLARTAADPRRLGLVREECRKTVAEFVRDWFVREDHWRRDRFTAIRVIFADEPEQKSELAPPVLLLK